MLQFRGSAFPVFRAAPRVNVHLGLRKDFEFRFASGNLTTKDDPGGLDVTVLDEIIVGMIAFLTALLFPVLRVSMFPAILRHRNADEGFSAPRLKAPLLKLPPWKQCGFRYLHLQCRLRARPTGSTP